MTTNAKRTEANEETTPESLTLKAYGYHLDLKRPQPPQTKKNRLLFFLLKDRKRSNTICNEKTKKKCQKSLFFTDQDSSQAVAVFAGPAMDTQVNGHTGKETLMNSQAIFMKGGGGQVKEVAMKVEVGKTGGPIGVNEGNNWRFIVR
ncbi:hypothetical protein ATANTOWER_012154 [Ataeniobius toweri]|uniref:Uncharacterized protein n=1 Tax=Ataeniobius toweri TaxID=208326 RepID=A0ABU7CH38_9TELE|nr:hypothetical protein [Ataeniobius toweri]